MPANPPCRVSGADPPSRPDGGLLLREGSLRHSVRPPQLGLAGRLLRGERPPNNLAAQQRLPRQSSFCFAMRTMYGLCCYGIETSVWPARLRCCHLLNVAYSNSCPQLYVWTSFLAYIHQPVIVSRIAARPIHQLEPKHKP
eukprot:scaffold65970_cov51-Prasinocladus_malaysianus.AAC.1